MAQTKKTNSKAKRTSNTVETIIADFHADFMTNAGATVTLDLYDNGEERNDRVKLTIGDAFIIYCTAIVVSKKKDNYAFLSYPIFYSEKKDQYFNQAYCFEKELITEINDALTGYYFAD